MKDILFNILLLFLFNGIFWFLIFPIMIGPLMGAFTLLLIDIIIIHNLTISCKLYFHPERYS